MAFIGTPLDTRNTFQSLVGKRFNGDGSTTAFTLDVAPSSTLDIEVFVGNVRQDPNSAYTLSGTTLTFTGAPPSGTNNIYVVHQAKSVGTIDPPAVETVAKQFNGGVVFNEDSADVDFRVESNGNANMLVVNGGEDKVGIGADPTQAKLHIITNDSGALNDSNSDDFMIENTSATGMTIGSSNTGEGHIHFSDSDDADVGTISYFHSDNYMRMRVNASEALRLTGQKLSTGGETAPDVDAGGITIDLNANDGKFISLKSSDYSHGITDSLETDTGFAIEKSQAGGGVSMIACNDGQNENIFNLTSIMGETNTTVTNTSAGGNFTFTASCKGDSGPGTKNVADDGNAWVLRNNGSARLIFKGDGEIHSDTGSTTYDAYEDAQLVRAFDLSHGRGVINSKFDKFISYNHEKLADLGLVGRDEDGTPNHFTNITGMQKLHNGAIWQQYEKHNQLLEAVYDLAKEAVGEEKADAILDKHEVKRLQ
jgi:hypothetical protein